MPIAARFLAVAALILFAATDAVAAADPPPDRLATMMQATALVMAGKPAEAANLLDGIVKADPRDALALRLLADARLRAAQADAALDAYRKLLVLQPDSPRALYGIGSAHALRDEREPAFAWLAKAKATRRLDMTMMDSDANLKGLRDDPRFAALRATKRSDYDNPFVEKVKIIREWDGEAANDQFGWIARSVA